MTHLHTQLSHKEGFLIQLFSIINPDSDGFRYSCDITLLFSLGQNAKYKEAGVKPYSLLLSNSISCSADRGKQLFISMDLNRRPSLLLSPSYLYLRRQLYNPYLGPHMAFFFHFHYHQTLSWLSHGLRLFGRGKHKVWLGNMPT